VLSGAVLVLAAISAPWRVWLEDRERQWVWLLSLGLLVGIWSMKAGITPGLSLRFLLVSALTLMHGWQLAVIGGAMTLAVLAVVGQASWTAFGAGLLCVVIVPALFTACCTSSSTRACRTTIHLLLRHRVRRLGARLQPRGAHARRHPRGLGLARRGTRRPEYFAVLPLMSFGEAFVNGVVMAMTVVYRPQWVMSFDDRMYLRRPEG